MSRAEDLINTLKLEPHPEGGYYRETFRSSLEVQTLGGLRSAGTGILYLLSGDDVSRFHRIDGDEIWFFHEGGPLLIYSLFGNGKTRRDRLAPAFPQVAIQAGVWFGAQLEQPNDYCLVSCSVMPGFEFSGFELADRADLLAKWPQNHSLIEQLT